MRDSILNIDQRYEFVREQVCLNRTIRDTIIVHVVNNSLSKLECKYSFALII